MKEASAGLLGVQCNTIMQGYCNIEWWGPSLSVFLSVANFLKRYAKLLKS